MKMDKKQSIVNFIVAVVTCAAFLLPGYAWACFGPSCENQDPVVAGCDKDAIILDSQIFLDDNRDAGGGTKVDVGGIVLFFSPSCNAKWAKVESFAPGRNLTSGEVRNFAGKALQSVGRPGRSAQTLYTKMTDGYQHVNACGGVYWLSVPSQSGEGCTGYY